MDGIYFDNFSDYSDGIDEELDLYDDACDEIGKCKKVQTYEAWFSTGISSNQESNEYNLSLHILFLAGGWLFLVEFRRNI